MLSPVLVTPPATLPVSLDEVKAHVNAADFTDDDAILTGFLSAAVAYLDGWTGVLGRCLITQTWRQDFYDWFDINQASARICTDYSLRLPLFPVRSISSVKYDDPNGAEQTVDASNYSLLTDDLGAFVQFKPTYVPPNLSIVRPAVRVEYVAGYADAASVPGALKIAILLLIAHWYANREAVVIDARAADIVAPLAVDALITPYRRVRF